jgi:hypothetical protein
MSIPPPDQTYVCPFCQTWATHADAIAAGWEPEWWSLKDGELTAHPQPVCPACASRHLHDPDGSGVADVLRTDSTSHTDSNRGA